MGLKKLVISTCPKCGKPIRPHTICSHCGNYRGKEVVDVLAKLDKKERKKREKEEAAKEKEQSQQKKPLNLEELSKK